MNLVERHLLITIFPQNSRRTSRIAATRPGKTRPAAWTKDPRQLRWTYRHLRILRRPHRRRTHGQTRRRRHRRQTRRRRRRTRARHRRRRARTAARWAPGAHRRRQLRELQVAAVQTPRLELAQCRRLAVVRHRNDGCDVAPLRNPKIQPNSWRRCRFAV